MNIQVKEYKNAKEFQKDAQKMLAAGWRMEGQSSRGGPAVGAAAAGALLLGPIGLLAGARRGKTTVTWINDEPLLPPERSNNERLGDAGKAMVREFLAPALSLSKTGKLPPMRKPRKNGWVDKLGSAEKAVVLMPLRRFGLIKPAAKPEAVAAIAQEVTQATPPPPPAPLLSPDGLYQWNGTSWIPGTSAEDDELEPGEQPQEPV